MIGRKDDPAFLYFPTNYRWSMGLLICLGGAPWSGAEIDEVQRVGRALDDHVGDDDAWFEEWTRMGDKIEARGRDERAQGSQAHRGVLLPARDALLPDRRAVHAAALAAQHRRLRQVGEDLPDAAAIMRSPRIEPVEVPYEGTSLPALLVHPDPAVTGGKPRALHGVLRRLRRHQGAAIRLWRPRSRGARHRLPDRRRAGQRRERALSQPAADRRDRALRDAGLRVSRRPPRVRSEAHRRDGAQPRRLLRAAGGRARAALRLLHRLGRAVGLSRDLGEAAR